MATPRQETTPRALRDARYWQEYKNTAGTIGSQERTAQATAEGEKGEKMTKSRVISKSVIRRIGAQVDAPDTIRQRSMSMIDSDPDTALLVLRCWHELQHIEEHAQAELEECDTLEDLQNWRKKWIA